MPRPGKWYSNFNIFLTKYPHPSPNELLCGPMTFKEVPGHSSLISNLIASAKSGQVAHALLFAGSEGGIAFMLALAFSQFLNCENQGETDSCGTCPSCVKTAKFIHPDLHFCFPYAKSKILGEKVDEIKAFLPLFRQFLTEMPHGRLQEWSELAGFENRTPIINIKSVREMMVDLQLKAYEGKYKIQIIWLPETMRSEGSNSFLKILEEPPPFTLFFLISQQPEILLPTVISRTQRISVPALTDSEVAEFLVSRFEADENKARAISTLAEGNLAEALALWDEKENDYHKYFLDWQRACYQHDVQKLVTFTDAFVELGKEMQKGFIRFSLGKLRQALALNSGAGHSVHIPENEAADLAKFGKILPISLLEFQMNELENAFFHIDRNASGRMVFFDLSLRLAQAFAQTKNQPATV